MLWYAVVNAEGYSIDRYSYLTESAAQAHVHVVAVKSPTTLQRPRKSA